MSWAKRTYCLLLLISVGVIGAREIVAAGEPRSISRISLEGRTALRENQERSDALHAQIRQLSLVMQLLGAALGLLCVPFLLVQYWLRLPPSRWAVLARVMGLFAIPLALLYVGAALGELPSPRKDYPVELLLVYPVALFLAQGLALRAAGGQNAWMPAVNLILLPIALVIARFVRSALDLQAGAQITFSIALAAGALLCVFVVILQFRRIQHALLPARQGPEPMSLRTNSRGHEDHRFALRRIRTDG